MKLLDQYKAGIITFLLSGIVIMAMFSIQLRQKGKLISESYYEMEPEPELIKQELEKLADVNNASSDKAFNEDQEYKEMMRNFKTISPNDFERTTKAIEKTESNENTQDNAANPSPNGGKTFALNAEETESYKQLQEELNKRLKNKKIADEHAKSKSTLTYSLKGRTLAYYKTPRYLCETGGRIVVSIRVNDEGHVFDAFINGASSSSNQCLINHAIEYAKTVRFDSSERKEQLGTITFLFKGKG